MPHARTLPKTRLLAGIGLTALLLLTLLRLAFLWNFEGFAGLREPGVLRAFYLGFKFDTRWVALALAPAWVLLKPGSRGGESGWRRAGAPLVLFLCLGLYVALLCIAMVNDVAARPWLLAWIFAVALYRGLFPLDGLEDLPARVLWGAYGAVALGATFLGYFVDFGAFAYIHMRLNGALLMFLDNPDISGRMLWQTYPILRLALLLTALVTAGLWLIRRSALRLRFQGSRGTRILARVAVSVVLLAVMWGKWSRYPLRWGEAFEARHPFHAHLALNPLLFFLETRAEMDGGYSLDEVKATHATLAEYFGIPVAYDREGLPSLDRAVEPRAQVAGTPNIVFIQLESLAAFKTTPFGNPLDPTPYLDRLCREGILFDRFFVVMENTSRSMFATLFGTPDVSSVQNATRNPLLVDQHTLLSALPEYDKSFWLGGSANWAQIRAALKNNVKDVTLHEEGSFSSPVVDVWGISDVDLLLEAHAKFRATRTPFWAYVQTSGNHPPFTIPPHHKDFRVRNLDEARLKAAGFTGNEEFNAVRLMDHALESFFEAARKEPYFANTIFLLWGDHGIPRGSTDRRFGDLTLAIHQVPFLMYAPGLLRPERRHTIASQVDILPTLVALLGRPARTKTLGKDLFDPRFEESAAAFTFTTFRRPPRHGLLQGDFYLNVEPDGRARLFRTDQPDPPDLAATDPERARRMQELARGFLAWSRFLLSHNRPDIPWGATAAPGPPTPPRPPKGNPSLGFHSPWGATAAPGPLPPPRPASRGPVGSPSRSAPP
ncbi:MAG: sulfatase-like hydrolase/transferase [Acidobacteria bacterium]|nr:sulfatase-like hydrolase/transferase [Acidobacteriota bacterium]